MASRKSEASKASAKILKERKITRTTGQCPWGCGRAITNGGGPLMSHLNTCKGSKKSW